MKYYPLANHFCREHRKHFPDVPYALIDGKVTSTWDYGGFRMTWTVDEFITRVYIVIDNQTYEIFRLCTYTQRVLAAGNATLNYGRNFNRLFKAFKKLSRFGQIALNNVKQTGSPSLQESVGLYYFKKYRTAPRGHSRFVVYNPSWVGTRTTQLIICNPHRVVGVSFLGNKINFSIRESECAYSYDYQNPESLEKLDEILEQICSDEETKRNPQLSLSC